MDLLTLILLMLREGRFRTLALNMLAQFGRRQRRYLGAELLPERIVTENAYREYGIRYRTIVAGAGTRYSPSQKRAGDVVGEMMVELGSSDIRRELTGRDYDALIALLGRADTMAAQAAILNWADTVGNLALVEFNEMQRWQAIVDAAVVRTGDNGYSETISYPDPAGHRVNAGGTWSDDTYDPYDDIGAQAQVLFDKGYQVSRIVTSRKVVSKMARNAKIAARCGRLVVNAGDVQMVGGRPTLADINNLLTSDGLPAIETYDLRYRSQSGDTRFLADNAFVMLATTGRSEDVDTGDTTTPLTVMDTLGYCAVGRAAGQPAPGRVLRTEVHEDKPPRLEVEGWQESLPVVTEPEAIAVIKNIS